MRIHTYRPHQGFVLRAKPLDFINVDVLESPQGPAEHWLALDEVWDPQNLGALLRSAYFLGMKVSLSLKSPPFASSSLIHIIARRPCVFSLMTSLPFPSLS